MPQRLLAILGAVAIALTVASLGQGALMEATELRIANDATGARLTPAAVSAAAQESAAVQTTPPTAPVRHARIGSGLERQKREAMRRNVQAALEEILDAKAAAREAASEDDPQVLAIIDPTPDPTVAVAATPEPTVEPTPEAENARTAPEPTPEATVEPTPDPTATPTSETIDPSATPAPDGDTHDFAYYLSEDFLRPHFGDYWQDASTVARCESSGNPDAVYSDGAGNPLYVGLYQIYVGNWGGQYDADMLKDPDLNARLAAELSGGGANWASNWPSCGAGL